MTNDEAVISEVKRRFNMRIAFTRSEALVGTQRKFEFTGRDADAIEELVLIATSALKLNEKLVEALKKTRDLLREELGEWAAVDTPHYPSQQLVDMKILLEDVEAVLAQAKGGREETPEDIEDRPPVDADDK